MWRKGWKMSIANNIYIHNSRAHSSTFPSLHLLHNWFSNPSVALPTSQLILQSFRRFTYIAAHSQTLLSLLLRHCLFTYVTWRATHDRYDLSFSNPSVASPTSHLILKAFRRFTYVTVHSPTLPLLHVRHSLFTYVTWRAAHDKAGWLLPLVVCVRKIC